MQLAFTNIDKRHWGKPGGVKGYANTPQTRFNEGLLSRPDGHHIYFHEYGNPSGSPVLFFHGGPGGGTAADYTRFFDPAHYRILLFDQRGCGKSTPNVKDDLQAALTHNTTQHLIGDAEALCEHLGLDTLHLFGGSWGSTLALAYAQTHPHRARSLVLRGIFTCTARDIAYFCQGNAATYPSDTYTQEGAYRAYLGDGSLPGMIPQALRNERMARAYAQAWHDYVSVIAPDKRGDMVAAYHTLLHSPTLSKDEKLNAAIAWSVWEGVTSNLAHDTSPAGIARFSAPEFAIAFAAIENHYFMHGAFLDGIARDQHALTLPHALQRISHLPIYIVHGAQDQVCPVFQAHRLVDALLKAGATKVQYYEKPCGHSMFEKRITEQLVDIMDTIRNEGI